MKVEIMKALHKDFKQAHKEKTNNLTSTREIVHLT